MEGLEDRGDVIKAARTYSVIIYQNYIIQKLKE